MVWKFIETLSVVIFCCECFVSTLRVTGVWEARNSRFSIIAKFGFQETDELDKEHSRGFIFGNLTAETMQTIDADVSGRAILIVVPQTQISSFFTESIYGLSCDTMLKNVSVPASISFCASKGGNELVRWIPCPKSALCYDEEEPSKVIPGHQMTLRIEESVSPKYWYLMIVGCELSSDCKWVSSPRNITVTYDLWLTNGSPLSKYFNPFGHQFSFDEQDSAEIYLLFLFLYIVLSLIHWRAVALSKKHQFEACRKIISAVIGMKVLGLSLQSLNVVVFAYDGKGISLARYLGEIFRVGSVCLMCLLLLLLSHGWSFSETSESICSNHIAYIWTCLSVIHFVLTTVNFFFVDDVLRDVDVFKAWPGYGMLMLRMVQALWFLAEIRQSIKKEPNDSKAEFLAHFGAGFLVWFLYLSGLGVISMFISVIWRFKVILVITTMANFIAVSCLVHLFWPTGSASKYFQSGEVRFSRRTSRFNSNELEDLEKLLIDDGDESDMEFSNEHFLRL